MNKKGIGGLTIFLLVLLAMAIAVAVLAFINMRNYYGEAYYKERLSSGEIKNPAKGLSVQEAVQEFDEGFVYYLLVNIKAYNLHSSIGGDNPRMEIAVSDDIFNAVLDSGDIIVGNGEIADEDVIIKTTKEEAIKMMDDKNYVSQSFSEGKSEIELAASKTALFSKGYLGIYEELTGKSVTGSAIGIIIG